MTTKIILIDDEVELLENLKELLQIRGFEVEVATSGDEGIRKIQKDNYDIMISDISMPDGDGNKVLNYVRSREDLINTPFIFLTAKLEQECQRKGIEDGAENYLMKPISIESLEKAIRAALSKKVRREILIDKKIQQAVASERKIKYHELRTPLFGIVSALEFLKSSWKSSPSEQDLAILSEAHTAALRMNQSFLNLERWINLPLYISKEKSKIAVREILAPKVAKSDRITDMSSSEVFFFFEKEEFDYIIDELISNARKFDSNMDGLDIFLSDKTIKLVNKQNYLKNYGSYTPEPFGQINRDKLEQQGLGLGLYLSKVYAHQNNFELTCLISESTFEISLSSIS
jgi:DNA-binding response OmpR family regulator